MNLNKLIPILVFLLLATACKDSGSDYRDTNRVQGIITDQPIPTHPTYNDQGVVSSVNAYCSDTRCSPSVALLLRFVSSNSARACTASLVGDGVMVTDDHCLGKLQQGDLCNSTIEVTFAASKSFSSEKFQCDKILWRSNDSSETEVKGGLDVAFFSIKGVTKRPRLQFSKESVSDNEKLTVYKVNPPTVANFLKGVMQTDECRVSLGTSFFPHLDKPDSPAFALITAGKTGSCQIIHGNSGSPFVNANGDIVGLTRSKVMLEALTEKMTNGSVLKALLAELNGGALALATSSICIPSLDNPNQPLPDTCKTVMDEKANADAIKKAQEEVLIVVNSGYLSGGQIKWSPEEVASNKASSVMMAYRKKGTSPNELSILNNSSIPPCENQNVE